MTVLIVIALVAIALLVDYIIQLRQAKSTRTVEQKIPLDIRQVFLPDGVFAVPGHLWSVLLPSGKVKLGIDKLISASLGSIDEVKIPDRGEKISKGDTLFQIGVDGHLMNIQSPFDGVIESVNVAVEDNPQLLSENINESWAVSVKPNNLTSALKEMKLGDDAKHWLKVELTRFKEFLNRNAPQPALATLQDGGVPVQGVLGTMDKNVLTKFEQEFLKPSQE